MKQHTVRSLVSGVLLALCTFLPEARGNTGFHDLAGRLYAVSNSHINKICQDHLGYIWLATDYGLARFDGAEAVVYTRTPEAGSEQYGTLGNGRQP